MTRIPSLKSITCSHVKWLTKICCISCMQYNSDNIILPGDHHLEAENMGICSVKQLLASIFCVTVLICWCHGLPVFQDQETHVKVNLTESSTIKKEYKRKCKSILTEYHKYCSKQYNITNIKCQNCSFNKERYVLCYSTRDVSANQILTTVPSSTQRLIILYDNTWLGSYPLQPSGINLTEIHRFTKLIYFEITTQFHKFFQLYPLIAPVEAFAGLKHLQQLAIRIPITTANSTSLLNMTSTLGNATVLDLSYTRGIGMLDIKEIFFKNNLQALNQICLRQFQIAGHEGYNNTFSIFKHMDLQNVTFELLQELDISNNMITNVSPGISKAFPNLKAIDLSGNLLVDPYNFGILVESVMHSSIEIIDYEDQGYTNYNRGPHIPKLNQVFDVGVSSGLPKSWPKYTKQQVEKMLLNCVNLISSGNVSNIANITNFFCHFLKCVQSETLQELNCEHLNMSYQPASNCAGHTLIPIGQNLRELYLGNLHYEQASIAGFAFNPGNVCLQENVIEIFMFNNNDKWLYAAQLDKLVNNTKTVSGLKWLRIASLAGNNITIALNNNDSVKEITKIDSLQTLDLSKNNVYFPKGFQLCKFLPRLKNVVLNKTNIKYLPHSIVTNCTHLLEISFKYNKLSKDCLENLDFNGTNKLSKIILSHNNITTFGKKFQNFVEQRKPRLTLDLSYNPLSCDCSNRAFINWLYNNKEHFRKFQNYYCYHQKGNVLVKDIFRLEGFWNDCNHWKTLEIIASTVTCTAASICLLILFIKKKWRLRYVVFQAKQKFRLWCCKKSNLPEVLWQYDAFISYCSSDRFWVHSVLMKTLEQKYGFKLCIHYRDFIPGSAIPDNIVESMSSSREIIIVLSEEATRSAWCQFELDQALAETSTRKQPLIIIKLGSINNAALIDPKISKLLDTYTYLEWKNDIKIQKVFWATLVGRLYKDSGCCQCCCCASGPQTIGYKDLDITSNDEEEDNQEVLESLPENAKPYWIEAQAAKSRAHLAKTYHATLNNVLENENVPHWAYGPLPKPVEELLKEHTNEIHAQIYEYANHKLNFLIKCLSDCAERQTQVYEAKMAKVEEEMQNANIP